MEKAKVCPNCGEEHQHKTSEYCCKMKIKECLVCKETFEAKCGKRNKTYCTRECSILHKKNECMNCGKPSKGKCCLEGVMINCEVCGKEHKTKCIPNMTRYCSYKCAGKSPGEKVKKCPNCGENHYNKVSDYCNKTIEKECLNCKSTIETKCVKGEKKYCNRKCSSNHKKNKCLRCGDPAKEKYCAKEVVINCKTCNKEHKAKCARELPKYCSTVCGLNDDEIKEKIKNTQLERYGAYGFNTKKQEQTMIERYGYNTPAKNEKVKEKAKEAQFKNNNGVWAFNTPKQNETMMKKYGSLGRLGDPEEMRKQREIMLERYGVETPSEHPDFLTKAMNVLMSKYGQIFNNSSISKVNLRYAEMLESKLGLKVEFEHHVKGSFFDLHLPDYNIAIEINPTVTHNSTKAFACIRNKCESFPCDKHKPLNENHHLNRARLAKDNDIDLIQVYEWNSDEEIIDIIKKKISISKVNYTEKSLTISNINESEVYKFTREFKENLENDIIYYGINCDNTLLAVASFERLSKSQWRLINYTEKEDITVYKGLNKIVDSIISREADINSIVSHVDFNHKTTECKRLNNAKFKEIKELGPRLVFHNMKTNEFIFDSNKDELEMLEKGFVKIYTAGDRLFLWKR